MMTLSNQQRKFRHSPRDHCRNTFHKGCIDCDLYHLARKQVQSRFIQQGHILISLSNVKLCSNSTFKLCSAM